MKRTDGLNFEAAVLHRERIKFLVQPVKHSHHLSEQAL
jgi:hypothetical protein